MTARHDPHDPLTPDERALAALLDASSAGPSPSLDARILAAARAAAAQPAALPHAPATSVPTAAIHAERPRRHQRPRGMRWARVSGIAASMVLVLGLGWRLALEAPVQHEAAADMAAEAASEEPVATVDLIKPPPPPPPSESRPQRIVLSPSADAAATAAADTPGSAAAPATAASARKAAPIPEQRSAEERFEELAAAAPEPVPMASPPPPAPVSAAPPAAPAPAASASSGISARTQQAEYSEQRAAAAGNAVAADDSDSLDRVQVTGSRIRNVDVDISDDARLPIADWFDRIRSRRAQGDLDGARGSLARFRAQHPRVAIPDDLRTLDATPR